MISDCSSVGRDYAPIRRQSATAPLVGLPSLLASLEKTLKVTILWLNEGRVEVRQRVLCAQKYGYPSEFLKDAAFAMVSLQTPTQHTKGVSTQRLSAEL